MKGLLLACLVLASASVVQQVTPQQVERVTEYRWCPTADGHALLRVVGARVDGRPAGEQKAETLFSLEGRTPPAPATGDYGP